MAKSQHPDQTTEPSSTPWYADWGLAYGNLQPAFLHALGQLAKSGFAARPEEAMDLVHDFFISEYPGLIQRYDARRSRFRTYAIQAFIFFARRRIANMQRWRSTLMDVRELSKQLRSPAEPHFAHQDVQAITAALDRLPAQQNQILRAYLALDAPSERKVAQQLNLTRYAVREQIADALARLSVAMNEPGKLTSDDWSIAVALWHDKHSVDRIASKMNRAPDDIRTARDRILRTLATALAHAWHG